MVVKFTFSFLVDQVRSPPADLQLRICSERSTNNNNNNNVAFFSSKRHRWYAERTHRAQVRKQRERR